MTTVYSQGSQQEHHSLAFAKLNDGNYEQWQFDTKMMLLDCGLWCIIGETDVELAATSKPDEKVRYLLRKQRVLYRMASSVDYQHKKIVATYKTAKEV